MKYKPLVVKGALAKVFIGSVHHVQGSAENCDTTRDSYWLSYWQMAFRAPDYQAYTSIAFVRSTIMLFLCQNSYFGGQTLEPSTAITKTSSGFLLVLLDAPVKTSPVPHTGCSSDRLTHQPQKGRSLSHDEWSTPLSRSSSRPFVNSLPPPPLACGKTWWKCKPTLRYVSYPVMESLIQKCTNAVQELIIGQFHLFVCKFPI